MFSVHPYLLKAIQFEVTRDISNVTAYLFSIFRVQFLLGVQLTMAVPFSEGVGTKVPLTMRFSTVAGEAGSADTNRDPRG